MIPLAVVTGDTHLAKTVWQKHQDLAGDSYRAFEHVVGEAISRRLPLILLGDNFDKQRPDSETVAFFCSQMDRMAASRLATYFIQGNHDYAVPAWPMVHSWPTWAHRREFQLAGTTFYGLDYTPRDRLDEELATVPAQTQVLLMHQAWQEMVPYGASDGSFKQIPFAGLLLTGDYHVSGPWIGVGKQEQPLNVLSPGSTCMQSLSESPSKLCFQLNRTDAGVLYHEPIAIPHRMFIDLRINTPAELDNVLAEFSQRGRHGATTDKPIVRLRFADTIADAYDRILAICRDDYHLFPEPQHAEVEQIQVAVADGAPASTSFDTLETGLAAMHQQGAIDDMSYGIAVRLLRAGVELPQEPQKIYDELLTALSQPAV